MSGWISESSDIDALRTAAQKWSTHEWLHFINNLPAGLSKNQLTQLDETFSLTGTQNAETAFAWYMQSIKGNYDCLLYTSPSPRDKRQSRMPSSA